MSGSVSLYIVKGWAATISIITPKHNAIYSKRRIHRCLYRYAIKTSYVLGFERKIWFVEETALSKSKDIYDLILVVANVHVKFLSLSTWCDISSHKIS